MSRPPRHTLICKRVQGEAEELIYVFYRLLQVLFADIFRMRESRPGCAMCTVHARSPYKRDTLVRWSTGPLLCTAVASTLQLAGPCNSYKPTRTHLIANPYADQLTYWHSHHQLRFSQPHPTSLNDITYASSLVAVDRMCDLSVLAHLQLVRLAICCV